MNNKPFIVRSCSPIQFLVACITPIFVFTISHLFRFHNTNCVVVFSFDSFLSLQMHWFNNFQFNEYWMCHQNGLKTYENRRTRVFSMIFVLLVMHTTMAKAVQISVDHVTINSDTIRAHRRAALFAYLAGRETIAPKVNHPISFLFSRYFSLGFYFLRQNRVIKLQDSPRWCAMKFHILENKEFQNGRKKLHKSTWLCKICAISIHFELESKHERQQQMCKLITISVQAMECARQQKDRLTVSVCIFAMLIETHVYKHDLYPLHVEREAEARRKKGEEARHK